MQPNGFFPPISLALDDPSTVDRPDNGLLIIIWYECKKRLPICSFFRHRRRHRRSHRMHIDASHLRTSARSDHCWFVVLGRCPIHTDSHRLYDMTISWVIIEWMFLFSPRRPVIVQQSSSNRPALTTPPPIQPATATATCVRWWFCSLFPIASTQIALHYNADQLNAPVNAFIIMMRSHLTFNQKQTIISET